MQNEHEPESMEELDLPEKNSVYDFLYHDINRINSFLSQFDPNGLLQSTTNLGSNSQIRSASATKKLTAKLPAVAQGDSEKTHQNSETNKEELSRTYDPLWQNSLSFLDYLTQKNLLNKDICQSNIGQFVFLSGKLFMFDIGFFQKVLQKTTSKQRFIDAFIKSAHNQKTAKGDAQETLELITALPSSIQARLVGTGFSTWSTLYTDGLSLSPDDLLLKHGFYIAGEWEILGILDALPDIDNVNINYPFLPIFQKTLADYSISVRPRFGRDPDSYGITPLMIFREVTGN